MTSKELNELADELFEKALECENDETMKELTEKAISLRSQADIEFERECRFLDDERQRQRDDEPHFDLYEGDGNFAENH